MKRLCPIVSIILILVSPITSLFTVNAQTYQGPVQGPLSVNAIVPPAVADFQFRYSYQGDSVANQKTEVTYEITYGASSSAGLATTNTIVARYSSDKAPDNSYLVEYVFGSATRGYGELQPVVDTKNRTITWTIPSLPEGTMDQKVYFKVRTTGHIYDYQRLTFRSNAVMSNEYVSLGTQYAQQDYLFDPAKITPGPTATPGPQTPTPTAPAPTPAYAYVVDLGFSRIVANEAVITALTSQPTRAYIRYGTASTALTQQTPTTQLSRLHTIKLSNLLPATTYYFQIVTTNARGQTSFSDIFTFKTAQDVQEQLSKKRVLFMINSNGLPLHASLLQDNKEHPTIMLPVGNRFDPRIQFENAEEIATVELVLRQNVLSAVHTEQIMEPYSYTIPLIRVEPGIYSTSLQMPDRIAGYELFLRLTDNKGNLIEEKIANLKTTTFFQVLDERNNQPLENVRVTLEVYEMQTKRYRPVNEVFQNMQATHYTDVKGMLTQVFPPGKYRATLSAIQYQQRSFSFTIDAATDAYPQVKLTYVPYDFTALSSFFLNSIDDTANRISSGAQTRLSELFYFNFAAVMIVAASVLLCLLFFSMRTQMHWRSLIPYFLSHTRGLHKQAYLSGIVLTADKQPISHVVIEVVDQASHTVLAQTVSNRAGHFHLRNTFAADTVSVLFNKTGYTTRVQSVQATQDKELLVTLTKQADHENAVEREMKHIAGSFFEVALLISVALELVFFATFGFAKTLPFFAISVFNILLWLFYLKEHERTLTR